MKVNKIIKYKNRKYYHKEESRYVTISDMINMVTSNECVNVIDHNTSDDITKTTLRAILFKISENSTELDLINHILSIDI